MLETFGTGFGQSRQELWTIFGWSEVELLCLFSDGLETDCRTVDLPLCAVFVLLLKLNNMLVCINYVSICMHDILT